MQFIYICCNIYVLCNLFILVVTYMFYVICLSIDVSKETITFTCNNSNMIGVTGGAA